MDVNAALPLDRDDLADFIYVDEMEREDAKQLLLKLNANLTDAEMENVFRNIGTSPLDLLNLSDRISSNYSVEDFVADDLLHASGHLATFSHKQILKALKDHPDGVSIFDLSGQYDEKIHLANPDDVGVAMKSGFFFLL